MWAGCWGWRARQGCRPPPPPRFFLYPEVSRTPTSTSALFAHFLKGEGRRESVGARVRLSFRLESLRPPNTESLGQARNGARVRRARPEGGSAAEQRRLRRALLSRGAASGRRQREGWGCPVSLSSASSRAAGLGTGREGALVPQSQLQMKKASVLWLCVRAQASSRNRAPAGFRGEVPPAAGPQGRARRL